MKRLNSGAVDLEDISDQTSNSTDYGLSHAEEMLREKEINDESQLALSEDDNTEELFENQSLHEMPQVSEATTEREDSDEEDIVTNENSDEEIKGGLKVQKTEESVSKMRR